MTNQMTYEDDEVVDSYAASDGLQTPEQIVLNQFRARLKDMRMLDIGVGAGRTTIHFAPVVKEYVGIDYSQTMIDACRRRFPKMANDSFRLGDARWMSFPAGQFDFVLFSYNGIDYVSSADRVQILSEARRVIRPGGYFFFSTHNLNTEIEDAFAIDASMSLKRMAVLTWRRLFFRCLNRNWRRDREKTDHLIINDGAHGFRLKTFYIRPHDQIRQLQAAGFTDIEVLALDGRRLQREPELNQAGDSWLHYLCRTIKAALFLRLIDLLELDVSTGAALI